MNVYDTVLIDQVEINDVIEFTIPDTDVTEQLVVQYKDDMGDFFQVEGHSLITGDNETYDLPDDEFVDLLSY